MNFPSSRHLLATAPRGALIAVTAGLLALVVRWYFVTHAQVLQPLNIETGWGDAAEYYRYAWHMVHQGVFSADSLGTSSPRADTYRDPGYPFFLALGMELTDNYDRWYGLILLSQAVMGGITVLCATLALRIALSTGALIVAGVTMALWPHLVSIPAYVLSESLTALLCALTALALGEAARVRSTTWTVAAGLALSLAGLTNSVLAPVILPLALVLAWKRAMPRRKLLVLVVTAIVPLLAWGARNAAISAATSSSLRVEINLVQGSWPTYHAASQLWGKHDPAGIQTMDAISREIAILHMDRSEGIKEIEQRMSLAPGTYLSWYLSKPALLWGWEIGLGAGDFYPYPTRNSPFMTNPLFKAMEAVTYILNGIFALLALVGLLAALKRTEHSAAILTFAVMATWVTLVYGVLQSDARYSIPFRTAEIGLACFALDIGAKLFIRRLPRRSLPR